MGIRTVGPGQIAAVVTHLRMDERPRPAPLPPSPLRLVQWKQPALEKYRTLFRRVGEPWLWFSRLVMSDTDVETIIHDSAVEIFAVCDPRGIEVGLIELDLRTAGLCRLAFFALVPPLTGQGHGRWMMTQAMALAWRKGVDAVEVHSCTLDHPAALALYTRSGFVPVRREIEVFDDPRLSGLIPRDAAPHVPLLG